MNTSPRFSTTDDSIRSHVRKGGLHSLKAGAYVESEGRVRSHSDGREVLRLDYEAYQDLAESEGRELLQDAIEQFDVIDAAAVHRVGTLGREAGRLMGWSTLYYQLPRAHRFAVQHSTGSLSMSGR